MKRTLSSSILKTNLSNRENDNSSQVDEENSPAEVTDSHLAGVLKPRLGGAGSAWKAGALSDASQLLSAERAQVVERIMNGRQELLINADQITDVVGTDRRDDWRDQNAYEKLKISIEKNGQDTPIHVWPSDPSWQPDDREPENIDGVEFHLIVGRRRHSILQELGRPIRAILVAQEHRGSTDERFEMLFMRFRENEERENLSAFERLISVGEMFEQLQTANPGEKISATEFSKRTGVHNSIVSRGRAIFAVKKEILHACKNPYELSHRDLETLLNELPKKSKTTAPRKSAKPKKLTVQRRVGSRKLSLTEQGGKLLVSASGLKVDKETLEGLGEVIAKYLDERGAVK